MRFVAFAVLSLLSVEGAVASALGSFNQIFVFGDSLSDNGNAAVVLGGTLPGNYAPNAFTNGPNTSPATAGPFGLWIDQFSALAGVPDALPALLGGSNYAVASAQTGFANPQDMGNQVALFGSQHATGAPSNALYAVWGGANDLYNGSSSGKTAADNLAGYISGLSGAGAKYFLWFNLPQLGNTPRGAANSVVLNAQSTAFDAEWAIDLAILQSTGVAVVGVDINSLFNKIQAAPQSYGFMNATSPAQGISGNPNQYLFWDTEHPTTAADALIAQAALGAVNAPEPAPALTVAAGIGGLCLLLAFRQEHKATL